MKLLIAIDELPKYKSRELIPLECFNCKNTFNRAKNEIQKVLKGAKSVALKFCSNSCKHNNQVTKIKTACLNCFELFEVLLHEKNERKFCSISCSNKKRAVPKPQKIKRILLPKKFCKCGNKLQHANITGMCKTCYLVSDRAMEQRGRTFSNTRKYKTNPYTNQEFYLMSSLEEKFFDLCIKHNIPFQKPNTIKYFDKNIERNYFPDFYLPSLDTIIEIKGYLTKEDKTKMELVKKQYPNLKIITIYKNQIENFFKQF